MEGVPEGAQRHIRAGQRQLEASEMISIDIALTAAMRPSIERPSQARPDLSRAEPSLQLPHPGSREALVAVLR